MRKNITIILLLIISAMFFYAFIFKNNGIYELNRNNRIISPRLVDEQKKNPENNSNVILASGLEKEKKELLTKNITLNGNLAYRNSGSYIFKVFIDRAIEDFGEIYLSYEYYGLEEPYSICRSINDNVAMGGYIFNKDTVWRKHRERISNESLKTGENIFRFSLPLETGLNFNIRNIQIQLNSKSASENDRTLWVNQPQTAYYFKKFGYINGGVSGLGSEAAIISINGKKVKRNANEFEKLVQKPDTNSVTWQAVVEAVFPDGKILSTTVLFDKPVEPDYLIRDTKENRFTKLDVMACQSFKIGLDSVKIYGNENALNKSTELSITSLRNIDFPFLSSGMVNVTGGAAGYRCLPHGTTFENDVKIELAYNEKLIPVGYSANDIVTFYFDEKQNKWNALQRDTIDLAQHTVTSTTNHFTDFVNAIIKVPEAPNVNAYTPTSIKELKAADPLESFNLMQPPVANNKGSANLNYPLWIPQGRQGLQPQINLTYNSQGGNGWMGIGWDISFPSISVETRWGVPIYDGSLETESYLLNGEELVPQVQRIASYENRESYKVFTPRIEGEFNKIERFGASPSTYYWIVTDKSGTKYYYGKQKGSNAFDPASVLRDENNNSKNIAYWGLSEVEDLDGNNVRYYYQKVNNTGLEYGTIDGYQLYIHYITYTGTNGTDGLYKVSFNLGEDPNYDTRVDNVINCRYGFKQVTANLLKHIDVYYNDTEFLKRYYFGYEVGSFNKTRLLCFGEMTNAISLNSWNCFSAANTSTGILQYYRFRYYNEVGGTDKFNTNHDDVISYNDNVQGELIGNPNENKVTALGGTKSSGWTVGGAATIGLDNLLSIKSTAIGGNLRFNKDKSNGLLALIDIDGDGMPDKVFKNSSGGISYRKQMIDNQGDHFFSDTPQEITGNWDNDEFLQSINKSTSFGGELQFVLLGASYQRNTSRSITNTYFEDVNRDGLVDIVQNGTVYFNKYSNINSTTHNFLSNTSNDIIQFGENTCQYIVHSGSIDGDLFDYPKEGDNIYSGFFPPKFYHDAVRVWFAPFDGVININAPITLKDYSQEPSWQNSNEVDGVRYFIQHNGITPMLDQNEIDANDFVEKTPTLNNINVSKGDRIYFRLQSHDNRSFDIVDWDPEIEYIDGNGNPYTGTDANNDPIYTFKASDDFLLNASQKTSMPYDGKIKFEGTFEMPAMSDNILIALLKYDAPNPNPPTTGTIVYSKAFLSNTDVTSGFSISEEFDVLEGESYEVKILSNSNIKWDAISFVPKIYYTEIITDQGQPTVPVTDIFNNNTIEFNPVINHSLYSQTLLPSVPITLSSGNYILSPNLTFSGYENGHICIVVRDNNNHLLYKKLIHVINGYLQNPPSQLFTLTLTSSQTLYFDFFSNDIDLANSITVCQIACSSPSQINYQAGLFTKIEPAKEIFGHLYRGWGQFTYNYKNLTTLVDYIDESVLVLSTAYTSPTAFNSQNIANLTAALSGTTPNLSAIEQYLINNPGNNPNDNYFIPMQPFTEENCWKGFSELTTVFPDEISHTNTELDVFVEEIGTVPIVNPITNQVPKAINKTTISKSDAWGFSLDCIVSDIGVSTVSGENMIVADYMDVNGDGFPDNISSEGILYSTPQGGVEGLNVPFANADAIQVSGFNSEGHSFGTRIPNSKNNTTSNIKRAQTNTSGSSGSSSSESHDYTESTLIDINGDGLPDKVYFDGMVALNIGYSFLEAEDWHITDFLQKGNSQDEGQSANIGTEFSLINTSISGGLGTDISDNYSDIIMMDVNGDGLNDIVRKDVAGSIKVSLNKGTSFGSIIDWTVNDDMIKSRSQNQSIYSAITYGFTIGLLPVKIQTNFQDGLSRNVNKDYVKLIDMDANGIPDFVTSGAEDDLEVYYSNIGKVNLLQGVGEGFLGSSILLDYELSQNSFDNPNREWVMDTVRIIDPASNTLLSSFSYQNPFYSRYDREMLGFGNVITKEIDTDNNNAVYRIKTDEYHNNNFLFKGLKYHDLITDAGGNKYVENNYYYCLKSIQTGDKIECYDINPCTGSDGEGYPALDSVVTKYYEGQTSPGITTSIRYEHGPYGNVKRYKNYGNINDNDDDFYATITYHNHYMNSIFNVLSIPDSIEIKDKYNNLLQKRKTIVDYFTYKFKVDEMRLYYDNANYIKYNMEYDVRGNLSKMTYPENMNSQRYEVEYVYDNVVYTYPVQISDVLGYTSTATYDYRWGKPTLTTDIAGNDMVYTYDNRGRLETLIAPYEDNVSTYSIKHEYWIDDQLQPTSQNSPDIWARTSHFDPEYPTNDIKTITFSDGLGRIMQTKKDASVNGSEVMVVSGRVLYDAFGREIAVYHPTTEYLGTDDIFNDNFDAIAPTTFTYDILNRKLSTTLPDNASESFTYDIEDDPFNKKCFVTEHSDFKSNSTFIFNNARNLKTAVIAPYTTVTKFDYSPMGLLLNSYDPENNVTSYTYDLLGRLTLREHPDAGNSYFTYDKAGNILSKQTQVLKNLSEIIEYNYNYNQLTDVTYPLNPEQNVHYEYGSAQAGNNAGKIIKQEDVTGLQSFSYGKLGELINNTRTFAIPNAGTMTFAMQFEYDTWNRTKSITYPDGEVVSYNYDNGGQLLSMQGLKNSIQYPYVDEIKYDKFGSRTSILYSNDIKTTYTYEPLRRRLSELEGIKLGSSDIVQHVEYTYDDVDNIIQVDKSANKGVQGIDYSMTTEYGYDNLYRLINSGSNLTADNNNYGYKDTLSYSPSGNIETKKVDAMVLNLQGVEHVLYDNVYDYGSQPHAVSTINSGHQNFTWDANGNMTNWDNLVNNINRFMYWDEENRLKAVLDSKINFCNYLYDASGERTIKLQGPYQSMLINGQTWYNFYDISNYTLYTNPYMVMTPENYTKHYYIESDRVVSKIGGGMENNIVAIDEPVYGFNIQSENNYDTKNDNNAGMIERDFEALTPDADLEITPNISFWLGDALEMDEPEEDIYFYNKDHLGSSTQITNTSGDVIHHIEYMPFGENYFEMKDTWETPYKFNGKELDQETGMYYYGARYYSPELSIWSSIDPLSDKYPSMSPFMYCAGNPVRLVDPNGMNIDEWGLNIKTGQLTWISDKGRAEGVEIVTPYKTNGQGNKIVAGETKVFDRADLSKLKNNSSNSDNNKLSNWDGFKLAWNTRAIGKEIPDNISFDLTLSSAAVGGASMSYSINLLTRGEEAGFHLTRTEQQRAGGEVDWGLNINFANYQGNPLDISSQSLTGPVKSVSGGWVIGGNILAGYKDEKSKTPAWVGIGSGIGFTYGGSYGWGKTIKSWNKN